MIFRIALGSASCKDKKYCNKKHVNAMCQGIDVRLQKIKNYTVDELSSLEDGKKEIEIINAKSIKYTYYKTIIENGIFIVVQGFVKTLNWPTYISINAIGHIAVEGVVIDKNGQTQEVQDNDLWVYR